METQHVYSTRQQRRETGQAFPRGPRPGYPHPYSDSFSALSAVPSRVSVDVSQATNHERMYIREELALVHGHWIGFGPPSEEESDDLAWGSTEFPTRMSGDLTGVGAWDTSTISGYPSTEVTWDDVLPRPNAGRLFPEFPFASIEDIWEMERPRRSHSNEPQRPYTPSPERKGTRVRKRRATENLRSEETWPAGTAAESDVGAKIRGRTTTMSRENHNEENSRSWKLLHCQWEIPAVCARALENGPKTSTPLIEKLLSDFVVLTGDENNIDCTTCAEFLDKSWHDVKEMALRVISSKVKQVLASEATMVEQSNNEAPTANDTQAFDIGYAPSTKQDLILSSDNLKTTNKKDLAEAIAWICTAVRLPPTESANSGKGLFRSTTTATLPNDNPGMYSHALKPLEVWPASTLGKYSCWTKLFRVGIVAWKPIQRDWGKGLGVSFNTMIQLAGVENYCSFDGGILLLGYRTALVPVNFNEQSKGIKWHFEALEETEEGFIRREDLKSIRRNWARFKDRSIFQVSNCFVGWFEHAHVMLGTRELLEQQSRMEWSNSDQCNRTLHPTGYEAGGQFSFSLGPINIAPQGIKTWGFVSNIQNYERAQDYRNALQGCRRSVALVLDSSTQQGWLVPMLSLILHLCHRWFQDINRHLSVMDPIPFAAPEHDGFQASLRALELSGDILVLGKAGEPDTETLRQLVLRVHMTLTGSNSTREEPKGRYIFATELMSVVDPPSNGSALRRLDVSGFDSQVSSWRSIVKHVDVIGVCKELGQAIQAGPQTGIICEDCCTLPVAHFYMAAHVSCLAVLAERAGSSIHWNCISGGACQLGPGTYWRISASTWPVCSVSSHQSIWTKKPCRFLQTVSKKEKNPHFISQSGDELPETGVVVFGDDESVRTPVRWISELRQRVGK